MKTLTVANEKGGVGKTTIVAHGGWYFSEPRSPANSDSPSLRVLLIDLDQQANLTHTMREHLSPTPAINLFASTRRVTPVGPLTVARSTDSLIGVETQSDRTPFLFHFRDSIRAMHDDYDLCIIDTPPSLTNRTYAALLAADAVLAPINTGDYSMHGVEKLLRAIEGVATHYGETPPQFLGLLPSIIDRRSNQERAQLLRLLTLFGQQTFRGAISKRDSYARASSACVPVWKMPGGPAKDAGAEIRSVLRLAAQHMQLLPAIRPSNTMDGELSGVSS